ncbi:hypothetical protein M3223_12220 [Paenibacillus pasadenensis]|uniref:hypothetical protein n=1 Tax=Paenibacillus pasadenensis TaxID=217090 RepID=UPI00203E410B|nr:hypothetical protein [Paenibacillus pasadenensis]MCM3748119.1 hypothetical protein [Paenibacillus pasadenensis]
MGPSIILILFILLVIVTQSIRCHLSDPEGPITPAGTAIPFYIHNRSGYTLTRSNYYGPISSSPYSIASGSTGEIKVTSTTLPGSVKASMNYYFLSGNTLVYLSFGMDVINILIGIGGKFENVSTTGPISARIGEPVTNLFVYPA